MTNAADSGLPAVAGPKGFWRLRAIVQTSRRHGLWAGFRLLLMFTRQTMRNTIGRYQRTLIAIWYAGLFVVGIVLLCSFRADLHAPIVGGSDLWRALTLLATALLTLFIALGKVLLSKVFQQQLWFYCLGSWLFAVILGGLLCWFFDPWSVLYSQYPSTAVLLAVGGGGVVIGFRIVIGWFVRSMLKPAYAVADPSEAAGLTNAGHWRVCIHEAGHALCYGLTAGIPEEASVGVDTDSFNILAGVVTLPQPRDLTSATRSLLEWHLLMLMAGRAAESHFLGEASVCVAGDMEAFSRTATQYLLAGYGEVFNMDAKSSLEVEANRNAIGRLRDTYAERAFEFISMNSETCLRLAQMIEQREYLDCEDLAALDLQVSLPHGNWPLRWPEEIALCELSGQSDGQ